MREGLVHERAPDLKIDRLDDDGTPWAPLQVQLCGGLHLPRAHVAQSDSLQAG